MAPTIVDSSFGTIQHGHKLTRTAHLLVPRDGKPGRASVVQAEIINHLQDKHCVAKVSILNDSYTWTVLIELTASELRAEPVSQEERFSTIEWSMGNIADDLLARAATILGC